MTARGSRGRGRGKGHLAERRAAVTAAAGVTPDQGHTGAAPDEYRLFATNAAMTQGAGRGAATQGVT